MLSYRTSLSEGGSRVILGERWTCSLQIAQIDHDIVQLTIGHLGLCGVGTEPVSLEYAMNIISYYSQTSSCTWLLFFARHLAPRRSCPPCHLASLRPPTRRHLQLHHRHLGELHQPGLEV
jgi:hypothetical protein